MGSPVQLGDLRSLPCPGCGQRQDLAVWLDQPGRTWLGERRIRVRCCGCGADAELELRDESMAMGSLRARQAGLSIEASPAGLVVRLGERSWFLAQQRGDERAKGAPLG